MSIPIGENQTSNSEWEKTATFHGVNARVAIRLKPRFNFQSGQEKHK